jgi:hypothetical protein
LSDSFRIPSDPLSFLAVPFGRAVTGQRSADNRKSKSGFVNESLKQFFFPPIQTRNASASRQICPKDSRKAPALTFPDTSLFIKVVRSSERKIDERLRSSTPRMAANQ